MSEPLTMHLPATTTADKSVEPPITETATPSADGPEPTRPMPGLATLNGEKVPDKTIDFAAFFMEKFGWSKDVAAAIKDHPKHILLIDNELERIPKLDLTAEVKKKIGAKLLAERKTLTDLAAKQISTDERPAAIATINAAPDRIAKAIDAEAAATELKKAEEEKARLAAQAQLKKDEEAAKVEAERKRAADEAAQKKQQAEEAAAKLAADQKKQDDDNAKKVAEEQVKAEAEAKRKEAEATKKKLEDEAAAAQKKHEEEAAAALKKKLEDDAAALKKKQAEAAAKSRQEAFGDRAQAHGAATQVVTSVAATEFDAKVAAAEVTYRAEKATLPTVKAKAKGATKAQEKTLAQNKAAKVGMAERRTAAVDQATGEKETHEFGLLDQLAGVAASPSGKALSDTDLAWVLTASAGKSALAQGLADVAVRGGMPMAKGVAGQADAAGTAAACLDLLGANFPATHALAAAPVLMRSPALVRPWLLALAPTDIDDGLAFATEHSGAIAIALKVQPVLGTSTDADDFVTAMTAVKAAAGDIDWLLALSSAPGKGFEVLCRTVRNYSTSVAKIRALHQAAGANFTLDEVAKLVENHRDSLDKATTAVQEADAHLTSYVGLVVNMTGGPLSAGMKLAFRAEALLRDAAKCPAGFRATVYQRDVPYLGGPAFQDDNIANGARTGFVRLTFPTGPTADVHTHWNSKVKSIGKISSMHIQGVGGNGAELEKWPMYFTMLPQAVVDAHNAASGTSKPTGGAAGLP